MIRPPTAHPITARAAAPPRALCAHSAGYGTGLGDVAYFGINGLLAQVVARTRSRLPPSPQAAPLKLPPLRLAPPIYYVE